MMCLSSGSESLSFNLVSTQLGMRSASEFAEYMLPLCIKAKVGKSRMSVLSPAALHWATHSMIQSWASIRPKIISGA